MTSLSTTDTSNRKSDIEGEKVQFQNESANKTNLDIEKEKDDIDLKDMEKSRIEQAVSPKV